MRGPVFPPKSAYAVENVQFCQTEIVTLYEGKAANAGCPADEARTETARPVALGRGAEFFGAAGIHCSRSAASSDRARRGSGMPVMSDHPPGKPDNLDNRITNGPETKRRSRFRDRRRGYRLPRRAGR